jgi:amino acid adenylation domain-containing protein
MSEPGDKLTLEAKRRLLAQALQSSGRAPELYPLSPAQERLWFVTEMLPGSPLYNVPVRLRLRGSLNVRALETGLAELVRRHSALRTRIRSVGGRPFQFVTPPSPFRLEITEAPAQAQSLAQAFERRPFDLRQDPPVRAGLFSCGPEDHLFVLVVHHIVSDGRAIEVLFRELSLLYEAMTTGKPYPLPETAVQFPAYAQAESAPANRVGWEKSLDFWRDRLAGLPPLLELPSSHPRPASPSFRGAVERLELPAELAARVRVFQRGQGLTPFMVLLAAYAAALHRYTGRRDLVVGTPTLNRPRRALEDLVGFLVNLLPIRISLEGAPAFTELATRVREASLAALAHESLPFGQLVAALALDRDPSHQPLVQVAFSVTEPPGGALRLAGLSVEPLSVDTATAKFDLTLMAVDDGARLRLDLEYSLDLFDRLWAERFLGAYATLLAQAMSHPETPISRLPLLRPGDRETLLDQWSVAPTASPASAPEKLAHELFEAQARKNPAALALVFEGARITYGELDARANRLAARLRLLDVGQETPVALLLDRGPDLITAILGVFKAGGAYVPLDPSHPKERLALILADTQAPVLLTETNLLPNLPGPAGPTVLCLDRDFPPESCSRAPTPMLTETEGLPEDDRRPGLAPSSDALAYIIYTSGSTGRPKGVMVEHRGLVNLAEAQMAVFGRGPADRIVQFASSAFDASIFEIMMAFRAGATLVLARKDDLLPGPPLVDLLLREGVTAATLPPSALGAILEGQTLPRLAMAVVAGEACPAEVVDRWAPGRLFFNAYGPTEITVWATVAQCRENQGPPDIGRPIPGARIYVLDPGREPTPAGVPGELYVGGLGLARGYLGRPDLTAERFVPDHLSGDPGRRLYRTGDLVRFRPDGALEFLGRLDDQVKIRGFRIEPGEIEAVLVGHPEVADAAVLTVTAATKGEKRLAAFVAPVPGRLLAPEVGDASDLVAALRRYLRDRLPEYMVPGLIVILPRLPKTSSGKTDRAALGSQVPGRASQVEPGGGTFARATEELVANIWADLLERSDFGPDDSFFDLGGHSLLLARMLARLEQARGSRPPMVELFRHPTVRTLAAYLESLSARSETGFRGAQGAPESDRMEKARARAALRTARRQAAPSEADPAGAPGPGEESPT